MASAKNQSEEYEIRQCGNENCRFRFPVISSHSRKSWCPKCNSSTILVYQLDTSVEQKPEILHKTNRITVGLLDNIRSILNVGSIFRTADGAGFDKLILSGITATPLHPKLAKTGLGAENLIPWEYSPNAVDKASELIKQGYSLWVLEESKDAISLFDFDSKSQDDRPIVLVVGNEITGVDPDILKLANFKIWIPMKGSKRSLNVAVAFGIAAYTLAVK